MLCKYKDIFGKVGEGAHSYRVFNIAIVDVLLTILLGVIIHIVNPKWSLLYILIVLFILGIVAHRIFCVRTTIDRLLFE